MPWTSKSAHGHTKSANTPAKKKKWSKIAEGLRKKGMEEGRAIRIANAAVGDRFWDGDFFRRREFNDWLDRKTKKFNAKGQEEGYFETEEGDSASVGDAKKKEEAKPITGRSRCPECEGKGVVHGKACQACGGDGWIDDEEKLRRQSMEGGTPGKKDSLGASGIEPIVRRKTKSSRTIKGGHSDDSRVQIIERRVEIVR